MVLASTTSDIITTVGAVIVAALGLWGAYITTSAVRSQTTDRNAHGEPPRAAPVHPEASREERLSREVEGYIVRFIILSLVLELWSAILNVSTPFHYLGGARVDLAASLVYALIFLLLGLPLLVDIYRRYGMRGRPRLRHR